MDPRPDLRRAPRRCAALLVLAALLGCADEPVPGPPPPSVAPATSVPAPRDERLGQALQELGQGRMDACRELAAAVLAEHPGHPRAELLLGLGYHKDKQYALALPHLEAADASTTTFAGSEGTSYFVGWCRYWLGDPAGAREAFARHVAATDDADSHFGLALVATELGDDAEAERELGLALAGFEARRAAGDATADLDMAKTHARRSDLLEARGDLDEAQAALELATTLDPARAGVWYKLWRVAEARGDDATARRALAEYERRSAATERGMATE